MNLLLLLPVLVSGAHHVKYTHSAEGTCEIVAEDVNAAHRLADHTGKVHIYRGPLVHHSPLDEEPAHETHDEIVEVYGGSADEVDATVATDCSSVNRPEAAKTAFEGTSELIEYKSSGPSSNRIDVTFMGDGYTADEKGKFFSDLARLTDDMFEGVTLFSWLPLFNIWHLFVESNESGVGINSQPRDTRYQLYRQGTQLRGVSPTNAGRNNLRADCQLAPGCDYPSVISNDPYYGGLGGEFVVSTESETSGTIVLRHEMGHNFVNVGEGYDGGSAYRGANFDSSRTNIKWAHWLTDQSSSTPVEEPRKLALQDYPWRDISGTSYNISFTSDGKAERYYFKFTASGFPEEGSLQVFLDGEPLGWTPAGIGFDRGFHDYEVEETLSEGIHTITWIAADRTNGAPIRQLCSLEVLEYYEGYRYDNEYIGAYPVFDSTGRQRGYTPDHEYCLMRNMTSQYFNKPNIEGMWMQFLERMSLLDGVTVDGNSVTLEAVKVGQLREGGAIDPEERYEVRWFEAGTARPDLDDTFAFEQVCESSDVSWRVELQYLTPEVIMDPKNLLFAESSFVRPAC